MSNEEQFSPFGKDLFGNPVAQRTESPVAKLFVMPPFSILSARDGDWQERKAAWLAMGIESEVGREKSLSHVIPLQAYAQENMAEDYYGDEAQAKNTSIFDPVLCELMYHWFCAKDGQVVDPFAGGSVRGVVASSLGRHYWGCELRAEQVEANRKQAEALCASHKPVYLCGDSRDLLLGAPEADFIFSCPPYGDLETYSDDARDLSAMKWPAFLTAYRRIIELSAETLKPNRFACFIVGEFRDESGFYRNFVGETVKAFADAGLKLYNEAILVTSVGSASMRVTRHFCAGRKFAKTHQNVLIFCKGDWRAAADAAGEFHVDTLVDI
jgi:nuclear transport factor 2 (NTF2) superfamily protein